MRRLVAPALTLVLGASVAAGCGGGSSTTKTSTQRKPAAPAIQVTMRNGGPSPKANQNWPLTLTITHAGKPVPKGTVSYQFLLNGSVVARRPGHGFRNGRYHDELTFPAAAAGQPITLRVVVKTPFGTRNVDQPVKVKR